jgi:hypothetical protein
MFLNCVDGFIESHLTTELPLKFKKVKRCVHIFCDITLFNDWEKLDVQNLQKHN